MNTYDFASIIAKNNSAEETAIEGYMQMLALPNLPPEFMADIREIISDEMNHNLILNKWLTKTTGIKPAKT